MPSGRNSVYGPSHSPVYDPAPVHGKRKVYVAGDTGLPPFSVSGLVDGTGESPGFPIRIAGVIHSIEVTVEDAAGDSVDFDVLVNGSVVASHTASSTGLTTHVEGIPVAFNDILSAAITDFGGGNLYNLLIVCRM